MWVWTGRGRWQCRGTGIVAAGSEVGGTAAKTLEFPDGVLLPGLVDLHTHPAPSDWKYGIDPDVEILPRGRRRYCRRAIAGRTTGRIIETASFMDRRRGFGWR